MELGKHIPNNTVLNDLFINYTHMDYNELRFNFQRISLIPNLMYWKFKI